MPFTHFAWRPMQQLWIEKGAKTNFVRDPTKAERRLLEAMLIDIALKEQAEEEPSAPMKYMLGAGKLKEAAVWTD